MLAISPKFLSAWEASDHKTILSFVEEAAGPLEAYLCFRAALVLGAKEKMPPRLRELLNENSFLANFIAVQKKIYFDAQYKKANEALYQLKKDLLEISAVRGDYHFVYGYSLNLLMKTKQASSHHRQAADYYGKANLKGPQVHALFNLCVSYNHLNEKELFDIVFEKLRRLAEVEKIGAAAFPYRRLLVYLLINKEEYVRAYHEAVELFRLTLVQERMRDNASLLCLMYYLSMKCHETESFSLLLQELKAIPGNLVKHYQRALEEFALLEQKGFFTSIEVTEMIGRWKKTIVDQVSLMYLIDLLCEKLLKSRDYEGLLKTARLGNLWTAKKEHAINLIDFRYYEVVANLRLGNFDKAANLIPSYRSDALSDETPFRFEKAKKLEQELLRARSVNPAEVSSEKGTLPLVLDSIFHKITFKDKTIDLVRMPLIEKLILILATKKEMIEINELFEEIYGYPFDSIRHERKMNSLIERVRQTLGSADMILRRDKKLGIHPRFQPSVQSMLPSKSATLKRQHQIVKILSLSGKPVTISELENKFDYSRRTLQFDLKHLTEMRVIKNQGHTRNRHYYLA